MRMPVLLCSLLLSAHVTAQDLSKSITYRTVAVPLHVALDQISKQSGLTLFASDELASDPIVLSIKGAAAKDVIDHIASAVGAEWKQRSATEYMLLRPEDLAEKLSKDATDAREARIKSAIDRITKEEAKKPYTDAQLQQNARDIAAAFKVIEEDPMTKKGYIDGRPVQALATRSPAHHALVNLLSQFPIRRLAELEPGEKIVLSNAPNAMQEAFPKDSQSLIEEFIREQNVYADAYAKAQPNQHLSFDPDYMSGGTAPIADANFKILLVASRWDRLARPVSVSFTALDARGNIIGSSYEDLNPDNLAKRVADSDTATKIAQSQKDIPLSESSQLVFDALDGASRNRTQAQISDKLKTLIINPEKYDPLSFLVSDGLLALADDSKSNLVGVLPDCAVNLNSVQTDDRTFRLATFMRTLTRSCNVVTQTAEGWTTIAPEDRVEEWKRRTDRALLGKCLREGNEQGYISISSAADLALSQRADCDLDVAMFWAWTNEKFNPFADRPRHLLQFYASLTPAQISQMQSGGKLAFSSLTKDQWQILQTLAYADDLNLAGSNWYYNAGYPDARHDRTESLPNGIPSDGSVALKDNAQDILYAQLSADDFVLSPREISIESIGWYLAQQQAGLMKSNVGNPEGFHNVNKVDWIAPAKSHTFTFSFDFGKNRSGTGTLKESICGTERWTLDKLPADLKQKVDAAAVQAKQQMAQQAEQNSPPQPQAPPL